MGPLKLDTQTFWVHERARAHRRCCSISRKASLSFSQSALSSESGLDNTAATQAERGRAVLSTALIPPLLECSAAVRGRSALYLSRHRLLLPPSLLKLTLSLSLQRRRHQRYERPRKRGEERERTVRERHVTPQTADCLDARPVGQRSFRVHRWAWVPWASARPFGIPFPPSPPHCAASHGHLGKSILPLPK